MDRVELLLKERDDLRQEAANLRNVIVDLAEEKRQLIDTNKEYIDLIDLLKKEGADLLFAAIACGCPCHAAGYNNMPMPAGRPGVEVDPTAAVAAMSTQAGAANGHNTPIPTPWPPRTREELERLHEQPVLPAPSLSAGAAMPGLATGYNLPAPATGYNLPAPRSTQRQELLEQVEKELAELLEPHCEPPPPPIEDRECYFRCGHLQHHDGGSFGFDGFCCHACKDGRTPHGPMCDNKPWKPRRRRRPR